MITRYQINTLSYWKRNFIYVPYCISVYKVEFWKYIFLKLIFSPKKLLLESLITYLFLKILFKTKRQYLEYCLDRIAISAIIWGILHFCCSIYPCLVCFKRNVRFERSLKKTGSILYQMSSFCVKIHVIFHIKKYKDYKCI